MKTIAFASRHEASGQGADRFFMSKHIRAITMITLLALGLGGLFVLLVLPAPVLLPLPRPTADAGRAWVVSLSNTKNYLSRIQQVFYYYNPPGEQFNNSVILLEDGQPLPQPGSRRQDIRDFGAGRYSHLGNRLWFSTLRNDDPASNGRIYEIEIHAQPKYKVYRITLICLLGFIILAFLSLILKMKSLLSARCCDFKTAWDKCFPARIWRAFPRPETTGCFGFQAEKGVLGSVFWTRQMPCLVGVMLLALMGSYFRAYNGVVDWRDAVGYQAFGRSIVEHGTPPTSPLPYSMFLESVKEGSGPSYAGYLKYPSLGFQLFIGELGKWRGDYSQTNGLLVSAFFNVLFSVVLFAFSFEVTRNRFLSFSLVAACLAHRLVMDLAGRPLTDICLLFFLFAALWPMSKGKSLLSGFIFGLGYLFREVGIIYLPVLPLASPKSTTWRGYARSLFVVGCGYAFGLAVYQGILVMFQGGSPTISERSYYLDWFIGGIGEFDLQKLSLFFRSIEFYTKYANPPGQFGFWGFALLMTIVFRYTSDLGRRLVFIGLWGLFATSAIMVLRYDYPVDAYRYAALASCLFWSAVIMAVNRFRGRRLWFPVLLAVVIFLSLPEYVNMRALRALSQPREALAHITAPMRAKMRLGQLLKPDSKILSHNSMMDELIYNNPVLVRLPDYETWRTSKGNEHFDGITFSAIYYDDIPDSWPISGDILEDSHGVRFLRFKGFGDALDDMEPDYVLFLRE